MRVIAFSLWGDKPRYTVGAVRNAELARTIYPGWICRFYVGSSVPEDTIRALEAFENADVRQLQEPGDWRGMLWRFLPASEPEVEVFLSRDADSRLGVRERAAVEEWLQSGKGVHVMRDHPEHGAPILGGMWGARRGRIPGLRALLTAFQAEDRWQTDQEFLRDHVHPLVRRDSMVHDEWHSRCGLPFPTRRLEYEFVGQSVDEHDAAEPRAMQQLKDALARQHRRRLTRPLARAGFRMGLWPPPETLLRLARRRPTWRGGLQIFRRALASFRRR